ncbi:spfh domain band 7 family protein [Cyclospora cayetanensis]|uniref:Spfh domain band 7 family protein n=1 Tax=Cyclospora cayetanensis TaxID=88456 RepID=A0A1D3D587_9EIME|nr:spfh domain band 7 family protein [Cyclospora cayetanensis]
MVLSSDLRLAACILRRAASPLSFSVVRGAPCLQLPVFSGVPHCVTDHSTHPRADVVRSRLPALSSKPLAAGTPRGDAYWCQSQREAAAAVPAVSSFAPVAVAAASSAGRGLQDAAGGPAGCWSVMRNSLSTRPVSLHLTTTTRGFSSASSRRITESFFLKNHPGFVLVPHQMAYVIERFGRFHRVLPSGLHLLVPVVDRVAYAHSLKEETLIIPNQTAITRDNVQQAMHAVALTTLHEHNRCSLGGAEQALCTPQADRPIVLHRIASAEMLFLHPSFSCSVTLQIDGVLYVRVEDAYKASYGVENPIFAVTQLAQTTMRSELGKLTLDNTFLERDALNKAIVEAINSAAKPWGVTCLRYEIRDILLPANIRSAMERQAEAERLKRAEVLRSEGERERLVNLALGQKEATILDAEGHAEAVRQRAAAAAESVRRIAETTGIPGGMQALSLQLAENYVSAFGRLAESSNTLIIPADAANTAHMLGQALGVFKAVDKSVAQAPPAVPVARSLPPGSS